MKPLRVEAAFFGPPDGAHVPVPFPQNNVVISHKGGSGNERPAHFSSGTRSMSIIPSQGTTVISGSGTIAGPRKYSCLFIVIGS